MFKEKNKLNNKTGLIIVCFYAVPPYISFRCRKNFWFKEKNSGNQAINLKTLQYSSFGYTELCAVEKFRIKHKNFVLHGKI